MQKKEADPLVWGAWGAIIGGAIAAIANAVGELNSGGTVFGYAAGAFFWLWVVANIKNKLASRRA